MKLWRIEAVRGAAALYVVLHHLLPSVPVFYFGQEAVIVFFLVSGFVIEYSSAKSINAGFSGYFKRRFLRIYPVLLCLFVLMSYLWDSPVLSKAYLGQLAGNLLMLQDFSAAKPNVIVDPLYSMPLWSLHYEWWFYMLYYPIRRYTVGFGAALNLVGILGVVSAVTYCFWPNPINRILFYLVIWWIGVVFAESYRKNARVVVDRSVKVIFVYSVLVAIILFLSALSKIEVNKKVMLGLHPVIEFRHIVAGILTAFTAIIWQRFRWLGFSFLLRWGCWLSPISYSLYIAHKPLLLHAGYLNGIVSRPVELFFYTLGLIAFCIFTELALYPWLRTRFIRSRS